ncbi:MAG: cytochrome c oxidase assembly protein [Rickettsiaceae bacterium]|nr:cytochrome c oxidase assembly protein [Rickettsiaceae bacterium]
MFSNPKLELVRSLIYLIIGMVFLTFASVPIYNIFCKVTGVGGTTRESDTGAQKKGKKRVNISFDSNIEPGLSWNFRPKQKKITVTTGENHLVFYEAISHDKNSIVGTAVYNVTPQKAGKYFNKIECFCFQEQMIEPGQKVLFPVSFFIDPTFDEDQSMRDVDTIILSYSFFKIREIHK